MNSVQVKSSAGLRVVLILLLVVFLAVVVGTGIALADHAWSKYHWDLSTADTLVNPLKLGDNLSSVAWKSALSGASIDWNTSVLKNSVTAGASNANCDPTLGRVEVCNGAYGSNLNWLGIAQIWTYRGKDGHIAQAIVKLNDSYFSSPQYNSTAWRNFVMCQEVGHTFGLDHQDENFSNTNLGSCMDYTNDPSGTLFGQLNNEHPNVHDIEQMQSVYAHLNGGDGGGAGNGKSGGKGGKNKPADTGRDVALNTPAEWGLAVAQDAQGRDSRFVRSIGNYEVTTYVLWAR